MVIRAAKDGRRNRTIEVTMTAIEHDALLAAMVDGGYDSPGDVITSLIRQVLVDSPHYMKKWTVQSIRRYGVKHYAKGWEPLNKD